MEDVRETGRAVLRRPSLPPTTVVFFCLKMAGYSENLGLRDPSGNLSQRTFANRHFGCYVSTL